MESFEVREAQVEVRLVLPREVREASAGRWRTLAAGRTPASGVTHYLRAGRELQDNYESSESQARRKRSGTRWLPRCTGSMSSSSVNRCSAFCSPDGSPNWKRCRTSTA